MKKNLFVMLFGLGLISMNVQAHELKSNVSGILSLVFSPETVIQKQWNAYNSRDLSAFASSFSDEVEVYMFPSQLLYKGKAELKAHYADFFENTKDLYSEVISRTVNNNWVKDEVMITRQKNTEPSKATIYYQIEDGLISKMYFL